MSAHHGPGLVDVGSVRLAPAAAASYARALAAGAPDDVTSSYRDPEQQRELFEAWLRRDPGANFALPPQLSDHVKGVAVDLRGDAAKAWWREYGADYGWRFTDAREDWHIAYRPELDQHIDDRPAQPAEQEDGMLIITAAGRPEAFLLSGDLAIPVASPADLAALRGAGVRSASVSAAQYDAIRTRARVGA